jgi:hypothetical protein
MRAAENHRVHARILERRSVLADCGLGLLTVRIVTFDQRDESRTRNRVEGDARVQRVDERRVAARVDRRLRCE